MEFANGLLAATGAEVEANGFAEVVAADAPNPVANGLVAAGSAAEVDTAPNILGVLVVFADELLAKGLVAGATEVDPKGLELLATDAPKILVVPKLLLEKGLEAVFAKLVDDPKAGVLLGVVPLATLGCPKALPNGLLLLEALN